MHSQFLSTDCSAPATQWLAHCAAMLETWVFGELQVPQKASAVIELSGEGLNITFHRFCTHVTWPSL